MLFALKMSFGADKSKKCLKASSSFIITIPHIANNLFMALNDSLRQWNGRFYLYSAFEISRQ